MKPAPFEYFAPQTVPEALDLLHERAVDAKILSGGQSLMPMLNFRLVKPGALVDINGIDELAYIRREDLAPVLAPVAPVLAPVLAIGAATRQSRVMASAEVSRDCGLLSEALAFVGHPAIRNRGTIGGSLAHADPSAEQPLVAATLEAELVLQSVRGARVLQADAFFLDHLTTALEPDELLTEVRFPVLAGRTGWSFQEVSRRRGDFAVVDAAAAVTLDERGVCQQARVVVGGVSGVPMRLWRLEEALAGTELAPPLIAEAAELVKSEIDPQSDIHASAEYRRDVAAVLVRRALETARERAGVGVQEAG